MKEWSSVHRFRKKLVEVKKPAQSSKTDNWKRCDLSADLSGAWSKLFFTKYPSFPQYMRFSTSLENKQLYIGFNHENIIVVY